MSGSCVPFAKEGVKFWGAAKVLAHFGAGDPKFDAPVTEGDICFHVTMAIVVKTVVSAVAALLAQMDTANGRVKKIIDNNRYGTAALRRSLRTTRFSDLSSQIRAALMRSVGSPKKRELLRKYCKQLDSLSDRITTLERSELDLLTTATARDARIRGRTLIDIDAQDRDRAGYVFFKQVKPSKWSGKVYDYSDDPNIVIGTDYTYMGQEEGGEYGTLEKRGPDMRFALLVIKNGEELLGVYEVSKVVCDGVDSVAPIVRNGSVKPAYKHRYKFTITGPTAVRGFVVGDMVRNRDVMMSLGRTGGALNGVVYVPAI